METMTLEAASAGQAAEDAKGGLDFSAQPDPSAKKTPFEMLTNANPLQFVMSVYSGKPGCACGCRGTHRYNGTMLAEASADRGYAVTPDEVNHKQIKKVVKILLANWSFVQVEGAEFAYAELDGRSYCAYFKKQA